MYTPLREVLAPNDAQVVSETIENREGGRDLYLKGIFVQGGVRNQNGRVYPVTEISRAVTSIQEKLRKGFTVLGEADHPDDLNVNLDRVSHMITEIDVSGNNGVGKLKVLPTPMGNICKTLSDNQVKLGVSSRGGGNVDPNGYVSDYEIVTVDIVANPSAPDAYPSPIYERLMNYKRGHQLHDVAGASRYDHQAEKYLQKEILSFIKELRR